MIDVVVPVFAGLYETVRCIDSALASRVNLRTEFELIVIDDCSTDPGIKRYLAELRGRAGVMVLENPRNLGFVVSANRGLSLHADRDVVLLNSDTEVGNDWLDRLHACAYRDRDIGTVTPFSNNATICSFPVSCSDNPLPERMSVGELDAVFARVNAAQSIDMPTAVGFCMYVRRDCISAVGLFNEQRFGRGYGEENDFCRRALKAGFRNVLAADVFVFHAGGVSFRSEREILMREADATLASLHPDYQDDVRAFVRQDPAEPFRRAVEIALARVNSGFPVDDERPAVAGQPGGKVASPVVQLHVMHDLGGGIERWCRDYCGADRTRINLILKPLSRNDAVTEGLMLFAHGGAAEPIGFWRFENPVDVTAVTHPEYARVINKVITDHRVSAVLVSSLIGHSLDALATGVPTVMVMHDFFPACPAINIYYDGICRRCDDARIADCNNGNPHYNPFTRFAVPERQAVRGRLLELMGKRRVTLAIPSRSVRDHFVELFPESNAAPWVTLPHGIDEYLMPIAFPEVVPGERLRLVVLGMLSASKGMQLLLDALDSVTGFADIYLVGVQEVGEFFCDKPNVFLVERYALNELQELMQSIRPHAGLLLSVWPETYSYTLTELMRMAIPPVVTRVGAFSERVLDGETGFLAEPDSQSLVAMLQRIDADRAALNRVSANLARLPRRSVEDMVADYHNLLPVTFPAQETGACTLPIIQPCNSSPEIRQAVTIANMSKQVKRLELQLAIVREARPRPLKPLQLAEVQRVTAERQRAVAEQQRAVAEQQRALAADLFERERQRLTEQLNAALDAQRAIAGDLAKRDAHIHALESHRDGLNRQIAEMHSSTSWRISRPIRMLGTLVRRSRIIANLALGLLADPPTLPRHVSMLYEALRSGGIQPFKATIRNLEAALAHQNAWKNFRQTFQRDVAPQITQAVATMARRPLISVIVPTYNTERTMLAQMLDSVAKQLYPDWELCIADDCSTEPHVAEMLRGASQRDSRIKIHLSSENHGVAHASNRALDLVSGNFVVLLDHDDILEPQALYRVARSLTAEDPDMIYSDEIMVSANLKKVLQYALRPAFSPEFLRAHPYFVHMVGFRTRLLREIGGFDETLAISQDYDLMLRAAERAQVVTHIPEILYQWRIHTGSSGTRKMADVMATSKGILRRHLDRCGVVGEVHDGARFNLFDIRYPLSEHLRVAIVIPTKNHGKLVMQCVDSIRATVKAVDYDIVIIDHESDDPETLAYLASINKQVTVLHYSGPFNFSAINNWAIRELGGDYTHYLLCNNDIEATHSGWLERMLEQGQREDVGIVGAQLLYPDGMTIQHAGVCVGAFGAAEHYAKFIRVPDIPLYLGFSEILASTHEVSAVTAACLLIRKDAFMAVGGFDEALAVGFGDVDLCLRVGQQGCRVLYCPHAELLHHESFTRGKATGVDPHPEDSALFQTRWAGFLRNGDPYFHPGLNQNSTAWQIRNPLPCDVEVRRRVYRCIDSNRMRQRFSFEPD